MRGSQTILTLQSQAPAPPARDSLLPTLPETSADQELVELGQFRPVGVTVHSDAGRLRPSGRCHRSHSQPSPALWSGQHWGRSVPLPSQRPNRAPHTYRQSHTSPSQPCPSLSAPTETPGLLRLMIPKPAQSGDLRARLWPHLASANAATYHAPQRCRSGFNFLRKRTPLSSAHATAAAVSSRISVQAHYTDAHFGRLGR